MFLNFPKQKSPFFFLSTSTFILIPSWFSYDFCKTSKDLRFEVSWALIFALVFILLSLFSAQSFNQMQCTNDFNAIEIRTRIQLNRFALFLLKISCLVMTNNGISFHHSPWTLNSFSIQPSVILNKKKHQR